MTSSRNALAAYGVFSLTGTKEVTGLRLANWPATIYTPRAIFLFLMDQESWSSDKVLKNSMNTVGTRLPHSPCLDPFSHLPISLLKPTLLGFRFTVACVKELLCNLRRK